MSASIYVPGDAAYLNLVTNNKESFLLNITATSASVAYDFTGHNVTMELKKLESETTSSKTFTTASNAGLAFNGGTIVVSASVETMADLDIANYYYNLVLTNTTDSKSVILRGRWFHKY